MTQSYSVFFALAVSHLSLYGLHILVHHGRSRLGFLSSLLVFSLLCYLIGEGMAQFPKGEMSTGFILMKMAFHRIGNVSVLLVWLIAIHLFDDNDHSRSVPGVVWVIAATALVARSVGSYCLNFGIETGLVFDLLTWFYSQAVMLGFVFSALAIAVNGYKGDLVPERRKERVVFTSSVAILLLLMGINRGFWVFGTLVGLPEPGEPLPAIIFSIYTYCAVTALVLWKLRATGTSTSSIKMKLEAADNSGQLKKQDIELIESIRHAMENDKLYLKQQLTVLDLANHIGSQEYRVRRAINDHLGFRNFAQLVNHYRIDETARLLVETDNSISNVGIEVGYASLSCFHKAFKARHTITPKEYRVLHRSRA